jgi:hypothetical protein
MRPKGTKREPFLEMLVGSGAEHEEESAWSSEVELGLGWGGEDLRGIEVIGGRPGIDGGWQGRRGSGPP